MRRKPPFIVNKDEVNITRDREYAVIEFKQKAGSFSHVTIPEAGKLSDEDVIDRRSEGQGDLSPRPRPRPFPGLARRVARTFGRLLQSVASSNS